MLLREVVYDFNIVTLLLLCRPSLECHAMTCIRNHT